MKLNLRKIINKNLYCPAWYFIFINPIFIARYGLYNKIKDFARNDFSGKKILDVGCGIKPYKELFKKFDQYLGIDIEGGGHSDKYKEVDKFYNGREIPFDDNFFDVAVCTQVLEHVISPESLLLEIRRTLKPGGQIFLTMPFIWNEHEIPYDFNRFTRYEHERIFKKSGFFIKSVTPTCGVFRVVGQLISSFISENLNFKNSLCNYLIFVFLCFPVQSIFIILDFIFKNRWLTLDYVILAEKL